MAVSAYVPLAKPGSTKRNIVVGLLYLVLLPLALALLPLYLLVAIGTNYNGLGDAVANSALGSIPGVGGGGWSAAIVVFVVVLVAFGAVGAVMPSADDPGDGGEPEVEGSTDDPGDESTDSDGSDDSGDESTDSDGSDDSGSGTTDETDDSADGDGPSDESTDDADSGSDDSASDDTTESTSDSDSASDTDETQTADEPETQSFSGSGATVETGIDIEGGLTVVEATHDGDSNFQVHLVDDSEYGDMFVNEIGEYDGETAELIDAGEYVLDVEADGNWELEIHQPRANSGDDLPQSLDGEGPTVLGPMEFDGTHIAEGSHSGESNFQVHIQPETGSFGELVFNEIGEYNGETTFSHDGVGWVAVQADGEWELDLE